MSQAQKILELLVEDIADALTKSPTFVELIAKAAFDKIKDEVLDKISDEIDDKVCDAVSEVDADNIEGLEEAIKNILDNVEIRIVS